MNRRAFFGLVAGAAATPLLPSQAVIRPLNWAEAGASPMLDLLAMQNDLMAATFGIPQTLFLPQTVLDALSEDDGDEARFWMSISQPQHPVD